VTVTLAHETVTNGRGMATRSVRRRPALLRWPIMKAALGFALAVLLTLALPGAARADASWTWPLGGEVITQYRNGDDPYAAGQHRGIDIAGHVGDPVGAARAGMVTFAGNVGSSGLTVSVRTADGRYDTSYLHLSSIAVREGQRVEAGDRLGEVGTTGHRSAVQPHLHFGVRDAGSRHAYHDPLDFLPAPPGAHPERPRAPAPVPVPVRPVPVTAPARRPVRAPSGRPAAAPRRVPAPTRLPRRAPSPSARAMPSLARAPAGELARVLAARSAANRHPVAQPGLGPSAAPHPVQAAKPAGGTRPAARPAGGGPDLGWAAACAGLLLAAAFVGGTGGGRATASRSGARLARLLRPLAGRG
jgi:peptidase M23-like protein